MAKISSIEQHIVSPKKWTNGRIIPIDVILEGDTVCCFMQEILADSLKLFNISSYSLIPLIRSEKK